MHPRSVSVICYLLSGECGCVCNTRPSQPIEVTPLFTSDILRSPLIMTMIMIMMKAFMKALLYLFLGSWLMTNPYLTSYYYFILTFDYILLFPLYLIQYSSLFHITLLLYLFTGLFKLSRIFFLLRQVLEGSWVMGEECK